MAAPNEKSEPKKVVEKNETESNKKDKQEVVSSKSNIAWGSLLVALFALTLGLLTPPLLNYPHKTEKDNLEPVSVPIPEEERRMLLEEESERPCRVEDFWHEEAVPGFHIVCLSAKNKVLKMKFWEGGSGDETAIDLPMPADWEALKEVWQELLDLHDEFDEYQPWAIYSTDGKRLLSADEEEDEIGSFASVLAKQGTVLVYEGGQFYWPGVRIGFERTVNLYSIMPQGSPDQGNKNSTITLETLSLWPLVVSANGFLTEEECNHIQKLAEPDLEYSGVVLMDKDKGRPASDFRTSQTTFVKAKDDVLVDIEYRTASLVRVPRNHQEDVQVLRYGYTEKYDSHHDYFDPSLYQNDKNTLRLIRDGRRNRMATVFWYLSDVQEGGETVFPRFNRGTERSMTDCEIGLKVKPEKGKGIIFYSMTPDGEVDPNSLHGACPVKEGIKWAANKWVWNEPMGYIVE